MSGLAESTGAPIEYDLNGKIIMLSPLDFLDWSRLEQWMRSQIIGAAAASLSNLSADKWPIVMKAANWTAARLTVTKCLLSGKVDEDKEPAAFLRSIDGMLRMIHLSMQHEKKMSLSEVSNLLGSDFESLLDMWSKVFDISLPKVESSEEDADEDESKNEQSADQPENSD